MRGLAPALSVLTSLAPAQTPVLRAAATLPLEGRLLSAGASLAVAPDRARVAAVDADRLQLWDGRGGVVLKSTLPMPGPVISPSSGERAAMDLPDCGFVLSEQKRIDPDEGGKPARPTLFSPPPPDTWNEASREFTFLDGFGSRRLGVDDGRLAAKAGEGDAEALGWGCGLRVMAGGDLQVLFKDGPAWQMSPRALVRMVPAPRGEGLSQEPSCYGLVALAPDGSRVAAFWAPLEPGPSGFRWGASHLLIWRRGDRLPSLDLPWEGQDPWGLRFTPSGGALLASTGTELLVLDPATGRERAVIPTGEGPACWVPGEDRAVFVLDRKEGLYALWDLGWGEEVKRFRMRAEQDKDGRFLQPEAISPDGRWIAAALRRQPYWEADGILLFDLES